MESEIARIPVEIITTAETIAYYAEQMRTFDEWLERRRSYIGASDISAIIGIDEYKSAMRVYLEKIEGYTAEDNEFLRAGRFNEPGIIARYAFENQCVVEPNNSEIYHYHQNGKPVSYIACTPDAWIIDQSGDNHGLLEVKNTIKFYTQPNPAHYVQMQYQLACTGAQWGVLCYLIRGFKLLSFPIQREEEVIRNVLTAAKHFQKEHIEKRTPPNPKLYGDSVALYPYHENGTRAEVTDDLLAYFQTAQAIKEEQKEIDRRYKEVCEVIKGAMGNNEILVQVNEGKASTVLATFRTNKAGTRVFKPKFDDE